LAVKPRTYRSDLRAAQARETRARVVTAARELFAEQGYATTTIAAIARRAEVSPDTIYAVFGTKTALLKAVVDTGVGGDDEPVAVLDRAGPQAMQAEPNQRRQLQMFAIGVGQQLDRMRPINDILSGAAASDHTAAELRTDVEEHQRRAAMRTLIGWIEARGPLRPDVSSEEGAAILWTLASPDVHRMLRTVCAWSPERYAKWLADTLISSLLPDAPPTR
jgi:AcrR family transcriptional regulator